MPYAVTLRLAEDAASHVRRLLAVLAADDLADCAPHVTLAIYPDDRGIDELRRTIGSLVAQWPALTVEFAALGLFPGVLPVLWVAPVVTMELLRRHAELAAALPAPHPYYRPGSWVPHVTIAQHLEPGRTATAIAALEAVWQPFS